MAALVDNDDDAEPTAEIPVADQDPKQSPPDPVLHQKPEPTVNPAPPAPGPDSAREAKMKQKSCVPEAQQRKLLRNGKKRRHQPVVISAPPNPPVPSFPSPPAVPERSPPETPPPKKESQGPSSKKSGNGWAPAIFMFALMMLFASLEQITQWMQDVGKPRH